MEAKKSLVAQDKAPAVKPAEPAVKPAVKPAPATRKHHAAVKKVKKAEDKIAPDTAPVKK